MLQRILIQWNIIWKCFIKGFLFFSTVLLLERIVFLILYIDSWKNFSAYAIEVLWLGFRFSIQTTFFMALGLTIATHLFRLFSKQTIVFRSAWVKLTLAITSVLFICRIAFYDNFQSHFNYFLFQGQHENIQSLFQSVGGVKTYLFLLIIGCVFYLISYALWLISERFFNQKTFRLSNLLSLKNTGILGLVLIVIICFLSRYGGSLRSADRIRWENLDRTPSVFLNELILDDYQALIRARKQRNAMIYSSQQYATKEKILEYGLLLKDDQNIGPFQSLDDYLIRKAKGNKIPKPNHIFVIISESYGQWPLFDSYKQWHLADQMKKLIDEPNTVWIRNLLPNGNFTHFALTGIVGGTIGLNEAATYANESYREAFSTGIASNLKPLGYKTQFWYGGPGSWHQVRQYVLAQGFDFFYGSGELGLALDNAWGIDDHRLYSEILQQTQANESVLNVILTTSNHPPFSINLEKEGIDIEKIRQNLPKNIQNDNKLVAKLAHFYYADREMANFIAKMREKHPDSLFIVMGDHSTRLDIEEHLSLFERQSIPLIISGPGVNSELFPPNTVGSQIQVTATLVELIAPKDSLYYSLAPSLTENSLKGVNLDYWITENQIGARQSKIIENYGNNDTGNERNSEWEEAMIAFSWWRQSRGNLLK